VWSSVVTLFGLMIAALLPLMVTADWGAASGEGLRRGRGWARWAVLVTFSLWTAAMLAGLVGAAVLPDGSSAGGVIVMLLLLAVCVTIVVQAARARGGSLPGGSRARKPWKGPHDRS
jgi:hypothetical protein